MEWISVKDKLPDPSKEERCNILAYSPECGIFASYFIRERCGDGTEYLGWGYDDHYGGIADFDMVTYWIPFPEPPKSGECAREDYKAVEIRVPPPWDGTLIPEL